MTQTESTHLQWVDITRIFASLLVVVIHVSSPLLSRFGTISISDWWAGNIYDSIARIAVPLFLMVSGALLLGKEESIGDYLKKRVTKVLIPLLAWTVIYLLFSAWYDGSGITLKKVLKLWYQPAYYHLWFMYTIVGLYMIVPIIRAFVVNSSRTLLLYYLAVWAFSASILPQLTNPLQITWLPDLRLASGFAGYLVLGYFLSTFQPSQKLILSGSVAFVIGIAATIFLTSTATFSKGEFVGTYFEYLNPAVVLSSTGAFCLLVTLGAGVAAKFDHPNTLTTLGTASFGVYLFHIIPLAILERGLFGVSLTGWLFNPWLAIPVTTLAVFIISTTVVLGLRRIPWVRLIVP